MKLNIEKLIGYGLSLAMIAILIISQFSTFLIKGNEMSYLIAFAGIASLFMTHIYSAVKDVQNNLNTCTIPNASFTCPYSSEGIKVITNVKDYPDLFDNFTGIYYAFNAPLRFETSNLDYQVDIHTNRYKSNTFSEAHYYYPVFSYLDQNELNKWIKNIYKLYYSLNKKLNHAERNKIIFYVPSNNSILNKEQLVTYFLGIKNDIEECVMYIHNRAFTTDTKPNHIFVINNENVLKDIKKHIEEVENELKPIKGIPNFLVYLEISYPQVCKDVRELMDS